MILTRNATIGQKLLLAAKIINSHVCSSRALSFKNQNLTWSWTSSTHLITYCQNTHFIITLFYLLFFHSSKWLLPKLFPHQNSLPPFIHHDRIIITLQIALPWHTIQSLTSWSNKIPYYPSTSWAGEPVSKGVIYGIDKHGLISHRCKEFSFCHHLQAHSGALPTFYPTYAEGSFPKGIVWRWTSAFICMILCVKFISISPTYL